MPSWRDIQIRVANYKCFAEVAQGFNTIMPLNLVIGRNNAGKSALLDLVEHVVMGTDLSELGHGNAEPVVHITQPIDQHVLHQIFPSNTSGGPIPGSWWEFAAPWVGKPLTSRFVANNNARFASIDPTFPADRLIEQLEGLARLHGNPFKGMRLRRLSASRDISPETDSGELRIAPNGGGLTTVVQKFINDANLPSSLVEKVLLSHLNAIVAPDALFSRVLTQRNPTTNVWEVYLEEDGKGRISLTHSGSGLKTILLVLSLLYLVPSFERTAAGNYVFALEELENNLHPALQRRLLAHLRSFAIDTGAMFFLTTHSSVAIDLFATDREAQIVHVTHDRSCTLARRTTTYVENRGICDDLDVRASDILQANGVVWVEGPSDRLYFNRWIELWSNGQLKEGLHYQCVFYGGRLLSHLSAADPTVDADSVVKILRVNRNAIVLIDSDKRSPSSTINATKRRMMDEVSAFGGAAWVTAGREVEHYLPQTVLETRLSSASLPPLEPHADFVEWLDQASPGFGLSFSRNKVLFAESILPMLDRTSLSQQLDLAERLDEVCSLIVRWNGHPSVGGT